MGFSHTFSVFELRWRRGAAAPGGSRHYCVPMAPVCYGEPARGARAGLLRAHQPHGHTAPTVAGARLGGSRIGYFLVNLPLALAA
jgi:hypothetical protein